MLVTADPVLPVPPRLYGGIERIIALLIDGLVAHGHRVTLVAHADSRVVCDHVAYPRSTGQGIVETVAHAALIAGEVWRRRPDVLHSFGRLAYLLPVLPWRVPKLMSYQREVTRRTVGRALQLSRGSLAFAACSRSLAVPVSDTGTWHVVYNAVSTTAYHFQPDVAADAPLVFLGRIEHIKGTHLAIEVARRAGRRLVIAGNVPDAPEHRRYFETEIAPALDGAAVTYAGPVDDDQKNRLLGSAAGFLMPILWDEPFGIVMAEALACGTPVIGLRRGAVPEVVQDGVTGAVCDSVDAMVDAATNIGAFSRTACRQDAETRFSQTALVSGYEDIYRQIT